MALAWGWLSDGPCRGARWPFIYIGAFTTVGQERLYQLSGFYTTVTNNYLCPADRFRLPHDEDALLHKYQGPYGHLLAE
jgi:hypothetical protein